MKLKLVGSDEKFDCPRGIGKALIATGVAVEVLPPPPPPPPSGPTTWHVVRQSVTGLPEIRGHCPVCQQTTGCVSIGKYLNSRQVCGFPQEAAWRDGKPAKYISNGFAHDGFITPLKNCENVARNFRFWHCGIQGGDPVPEAIIQEFVNAWKNHAHELVSAETGPKRRVEHPPLVATVAESSHDAVYKMSDPSRPE